MKSGASDRLLGLISKTGESALKTRETLVRCNRVSSQLYFAKSTNHLINTIDTKRFAAKEVTVIYLSFTNVRISIALPGGGVSLEGGVNGAHNRK
jgi:hypothetical protein